MKTSMRAASFVLLFAAGGLTAQVVNGVDFSKQSAPFGCGGYVTSQFESTDATSDLACADFNNDGFADIAVVNLYGSPGVPLFYVANSAGVAGAGVFPALTPFECNSPTGNPGDHDSGVALTAGDLDANGFIDIVYGRYKHDQVRYPAVVMNNQGAFSPAISLAEACKTQSVRLADIDGDGDLDVVLLDKGDCRYHSNDGRGNFGASHRVLEFSEPFDVFLPRRLAVGDVDQNGFPDVAIAGPPSKSGVYFNREVSAGVGGSFDENDVLLFFSPTDEYPRTVCLGDLDGDAFLDAAITAIPYGAGSYARGNLRLLAYRSGAYVALQPEIYEPGYVCDLADADNANGLDLLTVGSQGLSRVYFNDGTGSVATASGSYINYSLLAPDAQVSAFADLNGDAKPDLAVGRRSSTSYRGAQNLALFNDSRVPATTSSIATYGVDASTLSSAATGPVNLWQLKLSDLGSGDRQGTRLTYLRFEIDVQNAGSNTVNDFEWTLSTKNGAVIYEGVAEKGIWTGATYNPGVVRFYTNLDAPDVRITGASELLMLRAAFKPALSSPATIDGATLQISLAAISVIGSQIDTAPVLPLNKPTSITAQVAATKLRVVTPPPATVAINQGFDLSVEYVDAKGNRDLTPGLQDNVTVFRAGAQIATATATAGVVSFDGSNQIALAAPAQAGLTLGLKDNSGGTVNLASLPAVTSPIDLVQPTAPVISGLSRQNGLVRGGESLTASGSGFAGVSTVVFRHASDPTKVWPVTQFNVTGFGSVEITIPFIYNFDPQGAPLTTAYNVSTGLDVVLEVVNGQGSATAAFRFVALRLDPIYQSPNMLPSRGIVPWNGTPQGYQVWVKFQGSGFSHVSEVWFGTYRVRRGDTVDQGAVHNHLFKYIDDTRIDVALPAPDPSDYGRFVDVTLNAMPYGGTAGPGPTAPGGVRGSYTSPGGPGIGGFHYSTMHMLPFVRGVSPDSGLLAGGYEVTISGDNFRPHHDVWFDGVPATSVTYVSDNELKATVPMGALGFADVTAGWEGFDVSYPLEDAFLYSDMISPVLHGCDNGVLNGSVAAPTAQVTQEPMPAISSLNHYDVIAFSYENGQGVSDDILILLTQSRYPSFAYRDRLRFYRNNGTARVPTATEAVTFLNATPSYSIRVDRRVSGGNSKPTYGELYIFEQTPPFLLASEVDAPVTGGGPIEILGINLSGVTELRVGTVSVAASSFLYHSDNRIEMTLPASPDGAGPRDVVAIAPAPAVASNVLTVNYAGPAIGSVTPASGDFAGGDLITIERASGGCDFASGQTSVWFGTEPATIQSVTADTLVVLSPAVSGGQVVTVKVRVGSAETVKLNGFQYIGLPAPTIETGTPIAGSNVYRLPDAGAGVPWQVQLQASGVSSVDWSVNQQKPLPGTMTLNGAVLSWTPDAADGHRIFEFQIIAANSASSTSRTTRVFRLTVKGGAFTLPMSNGFEAADLLMLEDVALGAHVRAEVVSGTGSQSSRALRLDGTPGRAGWTVTQAIASDPAQWPGDPAFEGLLQWSVETGGAAVLDIAFDYAVVNWAPAWPLPPEWCANLVFQYSIDGGVTWNLASGTGANSSGIYRRDPGTTAGGQLAPAWAATSIMINSPGVSEVDMRLCWLVAWAYEDAFPTAVFVDNLSISEAGPDLQTVSPANGPVAGNTQVTLTGANLSGVTTVTFGGLAAAIAAKAPGQITVMTPAAAAAGAVDVAVTDGNGKTDALTSAYTYDLPIPGAPDIQAITPASGPLAGGTLVTLTGANLAGVISVTFGGLLPVMPVGAPQPGSLTVVTPMTAQPGAVNVMVTDANGNTDTLLAAFNYDPAIAPSQLTISAMTPSSGPLAGGNVVVIEGTGFIGVSILFGPVTMTSFTVVSDARIELIAPAAAQAGVVTVLLGDGVATASATYTYAADALPVNSARAAAAAAGGMCSLSAGGSSRGFLALFAVMLALAGAGYRSGKPAMIER